MHRNRRGHERVEVHARERRRNEADIAERRVAAAHRLRVEEDAPHLVLVGDGVQRLAGIRHGGHQLARRFDALAGVVESVAEALPRVGLEGKGLRRRPGLRSHDEERGEGVQALPGGPDGPGIGRVEHADREPVRHVAEGGRDHLGSEAAAAHPGHDRRREAVVAERLAERLEGRDLLGEIHGQVEPAETVGHLLLDGRIARPERRVAVLEALPPAVLVGAAQGRRDCGRQGRIANPGVERSGLERWERGLGHGRPPAPPSLCGGRSGRAAGANGPRPRWQGPWRAGERGAPARRTGPRGTRAHTPARSPGR